MPKATRRHKQDARRLVRQRDSHFCQGCGISIVDIPASVHHRKLKGMGGSALLESPDNLVQLCGSGTTGCHGWVHAEPALARAEGWIVGRFQNPAEVPVHTFKGWFYLTPTGEREPWVGVA